MAGVEDLNMRSKVVLGLVGLMLQTGCIVVASGHGFRVRSETGVDLCGPRPSKHVVEELVRAEHGDLPGLELHCSAPVRRRVVAGAGEFVHGWYVTASVAPPMGRKIHLPPRCYLIHKRKHGFAIVAHADGRATGGGTAPMAWRRRDLAAIDRHLDMVHRQREMQRQLAEQEHKIAEQRQWIARQRERQLERERKHQEERERDLRRRQLERRAREEKREAERTLAERSREWKMMTRRPTPVERKAADPGPRPRHATQAVRVHLATVLGDVGQGDVDIKVYEPSKTWGRVQGSSELVWGWSVRARVRIRKKGERPRTHFYRFMFRGEEIVSTRPVGLGYSLRAKPAR